MTENIIILYQKLMYRQAMHISPVDDIMQHKITQNLAPILRD